jgi:hypothetical protein
MARVGIRVFLTLSFHTTIVIKHASGWHLLKLSTDGSVEPCCFRVRWEKAKYSDQKY